MANFTVAFTSGVTLAAWTDPAAPGEGKPSRVNPYAQRPLRRRMGLVGTEVELIATAEDVEGPADVDLTGRTFMTQLVEFPGSTPPNLLHPPGLSSVTTFTPAVAGHYTLVIRRRLGGGGVFLHLDVVAR